MSPPAFADAVQELQSSPARSDARRFRRYLLAFFAIQPGVLLLAFCVAGTQWFLWHDEYPGLRNAGYSQRVGRAGCEVLIYGDSSSLTGLDPSIIGGLTHLKTCNVSEGVTIQTVVGSDVPLQAYLRQNPAPRFLLGMWTSSLFRPEIPAYNRYYPEGMTYGLDYLPRAQFLKNLLLRRPTWFVRYSVWAIDALGNGLYDEFNGKARHQIDARVQRAQRNGQWPYPLPPQTQCVRGALHLTPDAVLRWQADVEGFRRRYSTAQTTVLLDIAPVPDCDTTYGVYAQRAAGLHDNAFERLPIRFFNEGDVHFSPEGSRYVSTAAARQILQKMREQGIAVR